MVEPTTSQSEYVAGDDTYRASNAPDVLQAQVLSFVHSQKPHVVKKIFNPDTKKYEDVIKGGEVPIGIVKDRWGFFSHFNSMTNIPRESIPIIEINFDICELVNRWPKPRNQFDAAAFAESEQARNLNFVVANFSVDGYGLKELLTYRSEQKIGQYNGSSGNSSPSKFSTFMNNVKGVQ